MKILYIFCFSVLIHHNLVFSTNRYKSTNRAKVEVVTTSSKQANVKTYYYDHWNDEINHSALYVFFKDGSKSLQIEFIKLFNIDFTVTITPDSKGFYLIPAKNNKEGICADLQINFKDIFTSFVPYSLEMVHIPEGSFALGSPKPYNYRNTVSTSRGSLGAPLNAFYQSDANGDFKGVFRVNSEDEIKIGKCEECLYYVDANIQGVNTYSGDQRGILSKDFPKGYKGFYQMRYELTEQQYCDFLNSLTKAQSINRINTKDVFQGLERRAYGNFIIMNNDGIYSTEMPNQACSFLSWNDVLAYSDWSGMRIMTELEFEKSSRGFDEPIFREYSWGGSESENEFFLDKKLFFESGKQCCVDGNIHVNYLGFDNFTDVCAKNGGDNEYIGCRVLSRNMNYRGPLQTGIHAQKKVNLDRVSTGTGYFGTLDLSGNLREPVVPVGDEGSRSYIGSIGDGTLSQEGFSNQLDWFYKPNQLLVYGYRGGCWAYHENHGRIADRFSTHRTGINERKPYSGYRGVKN